MSQTFCDHICRKTSYLFVPFTRYSKPGKRKLYCVAQKGLKRFPSMPCVHRYCVNVSPSSPEFIKTTKEQKEPPPSSQYQTDNSRLSLWLLLTLVLNPSVAKCITTNNVILLPPPIGHKKVNKIVALLFWRQNNTKWAFFLVGTFKNFPGQHTSK